MNMHRVAIYYIIVYYQAAQVVLFPLSFISVIFLDLLFEPSFDTGVSAPFNWLCDDEIVS